jgi:hypothetical protein
MCLGIRNGTKGMNQNSFVANNVYSVVGHKNDLYQLGVVRYTIIIFVSNFVKVKYVVEVFPK